MAIDGTPDSLDALAQVLEALRATRSRLEKRRLLVGYLQALPDEALPLAVTYLGGRPFPRGDGRTLSVGGATLDAALRAARPELTDETVTAAWRRHADAGDAAAELWTGAAPADPAPIPLTEVAASFEALHAARGPRAKTALLVEAFRRMNGARDPRVRQGDARRGTDRRAGADAGGRRRPRDRPGDRGGARREPSPGRPRRGRARGSPGTPRARPVHVLHARRPHARPAGRGRGGRGPAPGHAALGRGQVRRRPVPAPQGRRGRPALLAGSARAHPAVPRGRGRLRGRSRAIRPRRRGPRDGRKGGPSPSSASSSVWAGSSPTPDVVAAHPVAFVAFDCLAHEDQGLLDEPLRTRRATLETLALPPGQTLAPVWTAASAEELDALFVRGPGPGQRRADGQAAGGALRVGPPRRPVAQGQASARHPRRRRGGRRVGAREAPGRPLGPHLRRARRGHGPPGDDRQGLQRPHATSRSAR